MRNIPLSEKPVAGNPELSRSNDLRIRHDVPLAARIIAIRHHLPLRLAVVVAELAGLGARR